MVTFLAAGHETTSGTLSFLFYHLLKNPEKLQKAQQEVDQVLGVCIFGVCSCSYSFDFNFIDRSARRIYLAT